MNSCSTRTRMVLAPLGQVPSPIHTCVRWIIPVWRVFSVAGQGEDQTPVQHIEELKLQQRLGRPIALDAEMHGELEWRTCSRCATDSRRGLLGNGRL